MILDRGGDNDDLDIRCVWSRGAVLNFIVEFRRREQFLIVRSEGGRFSNLSQVSNLPKACRKWGANIARERTCSKDHVLCKYFQELESTGQIVRFQVIERNAELVFETHGEHRVVAEISAYAGGINEDGDIVFLEDRCRTDTREHEDLGSVHCSAAAEH